MSDERETEGKEKPTFPFGKIVGFHGLKGEVKVRPSTNNPDLLLEVETVQTKETPHYHPINLEITSLEFDKRLFYLTFEGYEDRNSVEHLMGAELFTWEDQILELEEEEFWIKDLIGMKVVNERQEEIGEVIDIVYGGNDLLEIRRPDDPPNKTILIPFVKSLVPIVDKTARKIVITELEGLLEAQ